MSIASEITRISGNVADAYTAANAKGATMPVTQNSDNLATTISTIQTGTTPTGTKSITANGVYDVTDFASADVQVPTTAPAYYIEKTKDANGKAQKGSYLMDLSTFTDVGDYVLAYVYYQNTSITGAVDFGSLIKISGSNGCSFMFSGCTGITSVDLSSLTTVSGTNGCNSMFYNCTSLTSVDLSSLTTVSGSGGCSQMFQSCTGITGALDLGSLTTVSGGCGTMFSGCTGITSVDLSSLITISGQCTNMFYNCTGLTSVDISHLSKLGNNSVSSMFRGCTSLTSLSFPSLAYTTTDINSAFSNTLQGVTGCTVHFPSDWQTAMASYSNITNGLGGTNTTVLFDLPSVTALDLSGITSIEIGNLYMYFANNNYFPNITSVDLSSLTIIDAFQGCNSMFSNCTGITSVDLSSLTTINGQNACGAMFSGCTGLTSINLSSLTAITDVNSCISMFSGCTGLTSVDLSGLTNISGSGGCSRMFSGCTSLTSLSFPALTSTSFGSRTNQFNSMLAGVTGCTVHFPSNLQSVIGSWSDVTTGFAGYSTTVLFDLPATE